MQSEFTLTAGRRNGTIQQHQSGTVDSIAPTITLRRETPMVSSTLLSCFVATWPMCGPSDWLTGTERFSPTPARRVARQANTKKWGDPVLIPARLVVKNSVEE